METISFTPGLATKSGVKVIQVTEVGCDDYLVTFEKDFDPWGSKGDGCCDDVWIYYSDGLYWGEQGNVDFPGHLTGPIVPEESATEDSSFECLGELGIPTTHQGRKETPIFSGVLKYFPDALAEVAKCSFVGNEQHHPGSPLHWDKSKSADEYDALVRHLIGAGDCQRDPDGVLESAKVAWRALASLQREIDAAKSST